MCDNSSQLDTLSPPHPKDETSAPKKIAKAEKDEVSEELAGFEEEARTLLKDQHPATQAKIMAALRVGLHRTLQSMRNAGQNPTQTLITRHTAASTEWSRDTILFSLKTRPTKQVVIVAFARIQARTNKETVTLAKEMGLTKRTLNRLLQEEGGTSLSSPSAEKLLTWLQDNI